jgi:hypothetical protein
MTVRERQAMRTVFGKPRKLVGAEVWLGPMLTQMGVRVDLASTWVHVLVYSSRAAAEAYAKVNRERFGLRVVGPLDTRDGPVNVIDVEPEVRRRQQADRERGAR